MTKLRAGDMHTGDAAMERRMLDKEIAMFRKVMFIAAACTVVLAATACNTVKGVGRDIESVGKAGERAM